jgi:hypothetical protein
MIYLLIKAAISGVIIAIASDVARRFPGWGALVASLPLVSILVMIWMGRDTSDPQRIADHAQATFWFVLPSLPMFLLVPALMRAGVQFWLALAAGILLTMTLYGLLIWAAPKLGVRL